MESCSIYFLQPDVYFLVCSARTSGGLLAETFPFRKLEKPITIEIGNAVLAALAKSASLGIVAEPSREVLPFLQVKTWNQANRKYDYISVIGKSHSVTLQHSRTVPGGGKEFLPARTLQPDAAEIGREVQKLVNGSKVSRDDSLRQNLSSISNVEDAELSDSSFPFQSGWIAFSGVERTKVLSRLGIVPEYSAPFSKAIQQLASGAFLVLSVRQEILVLNDRLAEIKLDNLDRLASLSQDLGTVCLFGYSKTADISVWAKADKGKVLRAFAFSGEKGGVIWDMGWATQEENALGVKVPIEHTTVVFDIACAWSIDPREISPDAEALVCKNDRASKS